MQRLLVLLVFLMAHKSYSIDLNFRWTDGFCQKNKNPGYNPNYFGECGNMGGSQMINLKPENESLKGSNYNSIYAYLVNFNQTELSYTSFRRAFLLQVHFKDLKAEYIDLRGAILKAVQFKNISMKELLANGTRFNKTLFINCDLTRGQFAGASFQETKFSGSDLSGANLKNVSLLFTDFTNAKFDKNTQLPFSEEEALKKGMIKID
jgi:uncharacterized protein YjbI with pentapeptide repeats